MIVESLVGKGNVLKLALESIMPIIKLIPMDLFIMMTVKYICASRENFKQVDDNSSIF